MFFDIEIVSFEDIGFLVNFFEGGYVFFYFVRFIGVGVKFVEFFIRFSDIFGLMFLLEI